MTPGVSPVWMSLLVLLISSPTLPQDKPPVRGMQHASAREHIGRFVGTWQSRSEQDFRGEHIVVEAIEEFSWLEPTRVWLVKHVSKEDHPIIGPMNGIDLWAYDAKTEGKQYQPPASGPSAPSVTAVGSGTRQPFKAERLTVIGPLFT